MTEEQLLEQAYPPTTPPPAEPVANPTFADWQKADGWIEAPYTKQLYGTRKVLGIDCEMVGHQSIDQRTGCSVLTQPVSVAVPD